jgi:hypothetical protein
LPAPLRRLPARERAAYHQTPGKEEKAKKPHRCILQRRRAPRQARDAQRGLAGTRLWLSIEKAVSTVTNPLKRRSSARAHDALHGLPG